MQYKQIQAIFRVLKQPSLRISLGRESQITAGTFLQLMLALKVALGKDFFYALPSAESLCCAVALGANQAWGLGTPRDMGTWDLVNCSLSQTLVTLDSCFIIVTTRDTEPSALPAF